MKAMTAAGLVMFAVMVPLALAAPTAQQEYLDAISGQGDPDRGAQLFRGCAACHGDDGAGRADGTIPRLAGQHPRLIIRQLIDYRFGKRRDPRMEPVAHTQPLRDAQALADVAAFASALVPAAPPATGRGLYLDRGRQTYAARCAGCHGSAGQGDAQGPVPRLAGQHHAYLLRQFHDVLEGRRPELSGSHEPLLRDLDRDALDGLADLMSRLGKPAG